MARPRKVIIDPDQLLAGVVAAHGTEREHLLAEIREAEEAQRVRAGDWYTLSRLRRELAELEECGLRYDLNRFADKVLSGTERLRCQQTLRRLEAAGLVEIFGDVRASHVLPTAAALIHLEQAGNG